MPSFVPSLLKIKSLLLVTNAKFQAQSAFLPTTIYFRQPAPHPGPPPASPEGTPTIDMYY